MAIQLVITLQPNGRVDVTGPIQEKLLCLGLLAMAQTIVVQYDPTTAIIPVAGTLNPNGRGGLAPRTSAP